MQKCNHTIHAVSMMTVRLVSIDIQCLFSWKYINIYHPILWDTELKWEASHLSFFMFSPLSAQFNPFWELRVPYCIHQSAVGFIGCSAVQWGSHLGSVSSVSSVLLEAGWLDQVAVPDLWYQSPAAAATVYCVAPLLSSPWLCLSFARSVRLPLSIPSVSQLHMQIQGSSRQTVQALLWMASSCTSGGSVRSSVALQTVSIVLRMTHSTLQRMAVSQTVRLTDSTAQTDQSAEPTDRQHRKDRQRVR